jgi:hypothetical protein
MVLSDFYILLSLHYFIAFQTPCLADLASFLKHALLHLTFTNNYQYTTKTILAYTKTPQCY